MANATQGIPLSNLNVHQSIKTDDIIIAQRSVNRIQGTRMLVFAAAQTNSDEWKVWPANFRLVAVRAESVQAVECIKLKSEGSPSEAQCVRVSLSNGRRYVYVCGDSESLQLAVWERFIELTTAPIAAAGDSGSTP